MKKWIAGLLSLSLFLPPGAWAADVTEPPAPVSTVEGEEVAMTDPAKDVFITLTRTAVPTDQLPTTADIVRPEEFKAFNAQNVGEAISRETSVQMLPYGHQVGVLNAARIRGSTADQTLVLLDGRPVSGVSLGVTNLSELPVESIERVEILRGGASALYGPNAIGGVINIITKRATHEGKPVSDLSYEYRSYDTSAYRMNFGSRYGPLDYTFYGNYQTQSGFRDNSDSRSNNIGGNAGLSMGKGGKILVDIASYHANIGLPGFACGPADPFCLIGTPLPVSEYDNKAEKVSSSPNARQETDSRYTRMSYLLPLPSDSLMTLRLFGSERDVDFADPFSPNVFAQNSTYRQQQSKGAEGQLTLPLGFTLGGNFIRDHLDHEDRLFPTLSYNQAIENWGAFIQEEFRYRQLTLIPGARYDHNSEVGDSTNPRVQAMFDASDWLRFSGSAAKSFRAPSIDDMFTTIGGLFPFSGNPNLRPEKAWTYDGGFELHQASASFRATYFRANITDLIQTDPLTFATTTNIGEARRQGAEVQMDHVLNRYFQHAWNYTYLENRGIPSTLDHYVTLALSPRHTVNYTATVHPTRKWRMDAVARFTDTRYSGNNNQGVKMDSQLILDFKTAYQIRQAELFIGVNNLTNQRYQEQLGFPLPGVTAYGGINLRLWG